MGSVTPSSRYLAKEMAAHCDIHNNGIIVELGAGTGAVTAALLQTKINPQQLVIVEYSPIFAAKLRQQFPGLRIIEGNAANLPMLLAHETRPIYSIVSSLPLRTLSPNLREAILQQIIQVLAPHGKYIQFTYSYRKTRYAALRYFRQISSKWIWRNFPPARVDVWEVISAKNNQD